MPPFRQNTPLETLTPEQWEALCDGCGRCCLQKLRNPTTGKVQYTSVACMLLDIDTCRCTDYAMRHIRVPECLELSAAAIPTLRWLPRTCAYRLVAEKKPLPPWHPLVSGDPGSVHKAGISVRQRAVPEQFVHPDDLVNFIIKEKF